MQTRKGGRSGEQAGKGAGGTGGEHRVNQGRRAHREEGRPASWWHLTPLTRFPAALPRSAPARSRGGAAQAGEAAGRWPKSIHCSSAVWRSFYFSSFFHLSHLKVIMHLLRHTKYRKKQRTSDGKMYLCFQNTRISML